MTDETSQPPSATARYALRVFYGLFWTILALCSAYLLLRWDDIPERFPIHWGAGGQPDNWADRSLLGVFWPLGAAAVVGGVLFFIGKVCVPKRNAGVEAAMLLLAFMAGIPLGLSAVYLPFRTGTGMPGGLIACTLILVALGNPILIALIVLSLPAADRNAPRNDPQLWKWGFYNNPDDPAVVVEKRSGLGWTFNIAQPKGRLIVAAFLAIPLALGIGAVALGFLLNR